MQMMLGGDVLHAVSAKALKQECDRDWCHCDCSKVRERMVGFWVREVTGLL